MNLPRLAVVRELPLMWRRRGEPWAVRILLDYGTAAEDRDRYAWKDGEKLTKNDLEEVARMLVNTSDGCAGG